MGKKKKTKQLTQAQIWDDSALLQSWDEALEEYRLYHSIHARGERVQDVIKAAESAEAGSDETERTSSAAMLQSNDADAKDLEDGELEDEVAEQAVDLDTEMDDSAKRTEEPALPSQPTLDHSLGHERITSCMPAPVFAGVQDEALKNLMMSWYYAGYYTGLYEGQQKAALNQAPNKIHNTS